MSPSRWWWKQQHEYFEQQRRAVSPARARPPPDHELSTHFRQQQQHHRQEQLLAAPRPTERHIALGEEEDELGRQKPPAVIVKSPVTSRPLRAPTYYRPDVYANDRAQRSADEFHAEVRSSLHAEIFQRHIQIILPGCVAG